MVGIFVALAGLAIGLAGSLGRRRGTSYVGAAILLVGAVVVVGKGTSEAASGDGSAAVFGAFALIAAAVLLVVGVLVAHTTNEPIDGGEPAIVKPPAPEPEPVLVGAPTEDGTAEAPAARRLRRSNAPAGRHSRGRGTRGRGTHRPRPRPRRDPAPRRRMGRPEAGGLTGSAVARRQRHGERQEPAERDEGRAAPGHEEPDRCVVGLGEVLRDHESDRRDPEADGHEADGRHGVVGTAALRTSSSASATSPAVTHKPMAMIDSPALGLCHPFASITSIV